MDVRNCKMCGRLFSNVLSNERICPACQKKLEDKFHEEKRAISKSTSGVLRRRQRTMIFQPSRSGSG